MRVTVVIEESEFDVESLELSVEDATIDEVIDMFAEALSEAGYQFPQGFKLGYEEDRYLA